MSHNNTKISNKSDFGAFIPAFLDDYGLNPYEFRIYTHMARRAGKDGCFSSIPHMAKHCLIGERVARKALHLLLQAGLVRKVSDRPGKTDIYELTPIENWIPSDQLADRRDSGSRSATSSGSRSATSSGSRSATSSGSRSATSVVADQQPVVVADQLGEGINNEGITFKGIPSKDLSPLTPQGAEEKKEEGSAALLEEEKPLATAEVGQPESSRFVDREKQDLAQEPKILPETKVPPRQVEVVPATTAIEPFGNQRSGLAIAKERAAASVIPPGPWMVSGEIDDNFVNWIAKKFVARHGGDIFDAETNVLLSFENNPAKIPHYWRGYTREMGYRAANIAVQENAGIQSPQLQEHKQFVTQHQRALTNPSPDANHKEAQDLMNLASREFDPSHHPLDAADSPVALPAEPDWDAIADRDSHVEQEYLSSGAYPPQQAVADAPRDAYGQTESGDAYRPYKPAQVESVPPPKDLLKRVNGLAEAREMKPVGDRVGRRNVRAPQKSPIDLLNDMLADPICRRDRSVQIRAESYASPLTEQKEGKVCEKEYELYRDENGLIFKVEEIQF